MSYPILSPFEEKDTRYPLEILYYQGNWGFANRPSVASVGTRTPTAKGIERTRSLVKKLVADEFVIT